MHPSDCCIFCGRPALGRRPTTSAAQRDSATHRIVGVDRSSTRVINSDSDTRGGCRDGTRGGEPIAGRGPRHMDTSLGATKSSVQVSTDRTAATMSSVPGTTATSSGWAERDRRGSGTNSCHRRLQLPKQLRVHLGGQLSAEAAETPRLVRHHRPASTGHRPHHDVEVERRQRPQVDSLDVDASDDGHTLGGCGL